MRLVRRVCLRQRRQPDKPERPAGLARPARPAGLARPEMLARLVVLARLAGLAQLARPGRLKPLEPPERLERRVHRERAAKVRVGFFGLAACGSPARALWN